MRVFNLDVFDEGISGTSTTWYTPARLNDKLGTADVFAIMAYVTTVSGTSPTLTVQTQHSADGQNWLSVGSAEISTGIAGNTVYYGQDNYTPVHLAFVRLKINLGGTSPQCRLKLSVTGRSI